MSEFGVRHEVARVFIRDDPVLCHRDRTGTCVGGNPGVRSSRDNVASALLSRQPNREGTLRLPASRGGRELGLEGTANSGELPLSRRNGQRAKEAERLAPKGTWPGGGAAITPPADAAPPAERQSLTPPGVVLVCNVVSPIVSARTRRVVREGVPADEGVGDAGASEGRSVIDRIGVRNLPCPERGLTSGRSWITRKGWKD